MNNAVPPEVYDRDYLLSTKLEGYEAFLEGRLSPIKAKQLEMLALDPTVSLLEIGFGRGEFLRHCAVRCRHATGIDYSADAVDIGRQTLAAVANAEVRRADCRALPFADGSFDRVYSGDVIEHLSYADGARMLRDAWRVLRPGGFLLVHTAPNALFMRYVWPLARVALGLIDRAGVRRLDEHFAVGRRVHVHEYSLWSLRRVARDSGLAGAEAWIDPDLTRGGGSWHTRAYRGSPLFRLASALGGLAPVRFVLGNDLYLRCVKPRA